MNEDEARLVIAAQLAGLEVMLPDGYSTILSQAYASRLIRLWNKHAPMEDKNEEAFLSEIREAYRLIANKEFG